MTFRLETLYRLSDRLQGAGALAGAFDRRRRMAQAALEDLLHGAPSEQAPAFLSLPERLDDLPAIEQAAASLRARHSRLCVLGTGGSSLGGQAIMGALAPGGAREGRSLVFLDNIDPSAFDAIFDGGDLSETGFLSISKSGATAETVAQTLIAFDRMSRALGAKRAGERFTFVVEPGDSPLRRLAARIGADILDHDAGLGGRFSILSVVGLLPALYLGLDARALRVGAAAVLAEARRSSERQPAALADAAASCAALMDAGCATSVLMIYGDALLPLGRWWQQLIAESLGKDGRGLTPHLARGATDQHSLLQLYLAGPPDKFFTVLGPGAAPTGSAVEPSLAAALGVPYLGGRTLGALFAVEADATAAALEEAGRPVRRIVLDRLDAQTLGGLSMHVMVETVLIAKLIGVDPFSQPAVERGKLLARQMLEGRSP